MDTDGSDLIRIPKPDGDTTWVELSPSAKKLAYIVAAGDDMTLQVADLAKPKAPRTLLKGGAIYHLRWSEDEKWVSVSFNPGDGERMAIPLSGGTRPEDSVDAAFIDTAQEPAEIPPGEESGGWTMHTDGQWLLRRGEKCGRPLRSPDSRLVACHHIIENGMGGSDNEAYLAIIAWP